jgi:hypothetical protein
MKWPSLIWNVPGRLWAGMMASGSLSLWLTAGAGMAWTLLTACLVLVFRPILGAEEAFWIIMGALGIVFLAIGAMAGQEISLGVSRQGLNLNVGRDDPQKVEIATTTTVTAAPADLGPVERE